MSNVLWDVTSSYHSCTGDHFTAAANTTPAPAVTSLQKQPTVRHQRPSSCNSNYQLCTSNYHSCTDGHFPAEAATSSAPAATSPVPVTILQQGFTSSTPAAASPAPATTFLHLQTPATTSPEIATTFLYQQIPTTTSPGPVNSLLHQQIPVLNQRPPIQRIPVLYQLPRPAPATRSCSSDHHPVAAIVRRTLFRFTSRHNKVWPFEEHPCFVILA